MHFSFLLFGKMILILHPPGKIDNQYKIKGVEGKGTDRTIKGVNQDIRGELRP